MLIHSIVYGLLNHLNGLFADVDFDSEKLRCLGHLRFDVCGAWKLICPKSRNLEVLSILTLDFIQETNP